MPLNFSRIGGCLAGGCLVFSCLQCPEIGLYITGYLADFFLGQYFSFALNAVVWLLACIAGIGLIAARPGACWFLYIAFGYTLIPKVSEFSFFPFMWMLGGWLEINNAIIVMAIHVMNLFFVCLVVAVHVALVQTRCRSRSQSMEKSRRATIVVLLLGVGSIIVLIGTIVTVIHDALQGADIWQVNPFVIGLLFVNTPLLIWGIPAFVVACYRLWSSSRTHRQLQKDGQHFNADQSNMGVTAERRFFWLPFTRRSLWVVIPGFLIFVAAVIAIWSDAVDPARYNRHFHEVVAWADKIVVRKGGFDCCGSVDNDAILFEIVDPVEIAQLREKIQIANDKPSGGCLCCGYPGIDWYRNGRRIALTSVQHGHGLRWKRFPGDAYLTDDSQKSLQQWFIHHGMSGK